MFLICCMITQRKAGGDGMSKAVMISIRPKWCELIASGKKTIEVRKTRPKIEMPFKCYIYCTTEELLTKSHYNGEIYVASSKKYKKALEKNGNITLSGHVIGEFICNKIDRYTDEVVNASSTEDYSAWNDFELEKACIHPDDLEKYADGNDLYGWHISDLKIYDQPKELSDFKCCLSVVEKKLLYNQDLGYAGLVCDGCPHAKWENYHLVQCQNATCASRRVSPPQNLCYVEELK